MIRYGKYDKSGDVHWQWYADENHSYHHLVDDSLKVLKEDKVGSVIDIGFGDGLPASILEEKGFSVLGVEPNETGIMLAKEHKVQAEIYENTIEQFVLEDTREFDYLYSLNTIEHIDDPTSFVKIMSRIRKYGIIITDNVNRTTGRKHSSFHTHEFSIEELMSLFTKEGFFVTDVFLRHPSFIGVFVSNEKS